MKQFLAVLLVASLFSALAGAEWVKINGQATRVNVLESGPERTLLEILPGGFDLEHIDINGVKHSLIEMPEAASMLEAGSPSLPLLAHSVIIPDRQNVELRVLKAETFTMNTSPVVPSKGNLYRNVDPATVPYSFGPAYQKDALFPAEPAVLSSPFIMRDFRGATLRVFPVRCNPAKGVLEITRRLVVEIAPAKGEAVNQLNRTKGSINREFLPMYRELFVNFGVQAARYDTLSDTGLSMLIITADAYVNNLKPLIDWKRRKGYQVRLAKVSTVGNNATSIKNYILNDYNTNGVSYVLLVGEATEVAPGVGTTGAASGATADPQYACLAGSDRYPEIYVSRFSAGNAARVDVQVAKTVKYEREPQPAGTWYSKASGLASNEGTPPDYERMNWVRDTLLAFEYSHVDQIYQPTATSAQVRDSVNAGRSLVNYIGHGSTTSWSNPPFSVTNVGELTNTNLLPVVNSVACVVGDFAGTSTCFCEAWQWAGTAAEPRGSVVHYGSSINQSWVPPCISQMESNRLLARNLRVTAGAVLFNGSARMIEYYAPGTDGDEMFETWHIFGDASIMMRTQTPVQLSVTHPGVVPIGSGISLPVHVETQAGRGPVAGALVCATRKADSTFQATAYTDASGDVVLPITTTGVDSVYITVTGFNLAPYLGAAISTSSGAYVARLKHTVSDVSGNNDGVANPGETVRLPLWVINYGTATANGVVGKLRTASPNGSVTADSSYSFGDIAAGDSAVYSAGFGLYINPGDTNGMTIPLTLECRDANDSAWTSQFSVTVGTGVLAYNSRSIGGNGRLDPNETATMAVSLKNNGLGYAYNTNAILRCSDVRVTVTDSTASYGTLNPGATGGSGADSFGLSVGAMPPGTSVGFTLVMRADGVSDKLYSWNETVGDLRYSPTPDNQATPVYYAVEDSDGVSRAPVYSWAEIRGVGTQLTALSADDATASATLPFTFRWYGTNYTTLSMCSNGWVSFGSNSSTAYSNTGIPTSTFANPTIFPLWDDQNGSSSSAPGAWAGYWHDAANGRFIVEWDSLVFYSTSTRLKYQAMFYDSTATHPYYDVVLQYNMLADRGSSSVGFQQNSTVGCQLLQDGGYASTVVSPLKGGRAIRITRTPEVAGVSGGPSTALVNPARFELGAARPNPVRGSTTISFGLPRESQVHIEIYNITGQRVKTLASGKLNAGYHQITWRGANENGQKVAAGVYLVRMVTPEFTGTRKLTVLR